VGLLGTVFAAPAARATPAEIFGSGPRSVALAGSGTSLELGPESALLNPATLAGPGRKELVLGFRASRFSLELERAGVTKPYPAALSRGLMIGVLAPLSRGRVRTGFGLFAETPPDFVVRSTIPLDLTPTFPLLVGRAQALDLGAGLGARLGSLSLGVGVRALAALSGSVSVAEEGGTTSTGVGTRLLPAWAPVLGAALDLGAFGRAGLAVRSILRADFDVDVAATTLGPIGIVPLNIEGVAVYEPLRVDLELSRDFGALSLVLGARYERWSAFEGWVGPTIDCPASRPRCGTPPPPPPHYSDVVSPRLGVSRRFELRSVALTARAGYALVPTPAPEQHGAKNELDATRHGFAAGYSAELPASLLPLRLDASFRFDQLAPRTHVKTDPASGPPLRTGGSVQTILFAAGVKL
jgi:long-chain fatty acid transport protein